MNYQEFKKYFLTFLLIISLIMQSYNPVTAAAQTQALGKQDEPNILEKVGDGVVSFASTILTLNNPVRLEDPKQVFKATEKPQFNLTIPQKSKDKVGESANEKWQTQDETITASTVSLADNKTYPVKIKKLSEGKFDLTLENQTMLTPGRYSLLLSSRESLIYTRKIKQDFNWGVLVINTKKSIYTKGEVAKLNFGVIDDKGHTICDALLRLGIKAPDGQASILSTENGKIKPSGKCKGDSHTDIADYLAEYQTTEKGIYKLSLEAETKNGKYNIEDSFEVRDSVPFDVERTKYPSRIYPPSPYDVEINIKANQDYKGSISDVVPAIFDITKTGDKAIISPYGNLKSINWQVDFKKGQNYKLTYTIKFPDISPEFYLVGPLFFTTSDGEVYFEESRLWQIASDVVVVSTGIVETEAQFGGLQRKVVYTNEAQTATAVTDPGTFGTDTAVGTTTWSTASNSQTQDDTYATTALAAGGISHYLEVSNFGFSIPSTATIMGVVVEVDKFKQTGGGTCQDNAVRLSKAGTVTGTSQAAGGNWASTDTDAYTTYGSSSNLWGVNLTGDDVSASTFGIGFSAKEGQSENSATCAIDHIRMTVYYSTPTWYAFYNDGSVVSFKKSTDNGATWGNAVTVSDGDADNVNPAVGFSNNADTMQVFWFDTSLNIIEGRRIVVTTGDTQGTLCQTASLGTISSTFMLSVARGSDTRAIITYSDTSTDTEVGAFSISGLGGTCTATDVTTGNIGYGSGITAGDRPVLQRLNGDNFDVVFQDGDLSYSRLRSQAQDWTRKNIQIANVTDSVYSVVERDAEIFVLTVSGTTATGLYKCCTEDIAETSVDSDAGTIDQDGVSDIDMFCPASGNCKFVYTDDIDTATPTLKFVDCNDETCSAPTITTLDADIGAAGDQAGPSIYCVTDGDGVVSDNCKVAYGDDMDTAAPLLKVVDCTDDEDCSTNTSATVDSDLGSSTSLLHTSIYCPTDTNCKVLYNDSGLSDLFFVDCSAIACSTQDVITQLDANAAADPKLDLDCVASDNCKLVYHDGATSDLVFIDCTADEDCSTNTATIVDADVGATTNTVPVSIDCVGGDGDCKFIYGDQIAGDMFFVDCPDATCTSTGRTITTIDSSGGGSTSIALRTSLDCVSATDCKFLYVGDLSAAGDELLYFVDCDDATCSTGSVYDLPGAVSPTIAPRFSGAIQCLTSTNCKFSYYEGMDDLDPTITFADCDTTNCYPTASSLTAPWTSETNLTSVSLTEDQDRLIASVIKDTSEQAYYSLSSAETISWSTSTSYGFTAGDLGHISTPELGTKGSAIGAFLRQGANMEFILMSIPVSVNIQGGVTITGGTTIK